MIRAHGILFDLDGVLVDSAAVVRRQWTRWAREHGLDPEEVVRAAHGRRQIETIRELTPHVDVEAEARRLERREAEDTEGLRLIPGADRLVERARGGCWGVVTSGSRAIATTRLEHVGIGVPEVFVTAEDVDEGKPHPEAYRTGAALLGLAPDRCVVLEDSPAGIEAAGTAGATVIGVSTAHDPDALADADRRVRDLTEVELRVRAEAENGARFELRTNDGSPGA